MDSLIVSEHQRNLEAEENGMDTSTKVTVLQVIQICLLLDGLIETDNISFSCF